MKKIVFIVSLLIVFTGFSNQPLHLITTKFQGMCTTHIKMEALQLDSCYSYNKLSYLKGFYGLSK